MVHALYMAKKCNMLFELLSAWLTAAHRVIYQETRFLTQRLSTKCETLPKHNIAFVSSMLLGLQKKMQKQQNSIQAHFEEWSSSNSDFLKQLIRGGNRLSTDENDYFSCVNSWITISEVPRGRKFKSERYWRLKIFLRRCVLWIVKWEYTVLVRYEKASARWVQMN